MTATPTPTHYDTLGVATDADTGAIRRAWVGLARRHHPDVAGEAPGARAEAERRMQAINQAWEVLGDPVRRRRYDADLALERRRAWVPGTVSPDFVPLDDSDDPDDPAAEHDVPYGDGAPLPRSLQVGPLPIVVLGLIALGMGALLGFPPLVALGAVGVVGGALAFLAAPVYALLRSSRNGLD